jgi:hypothetical protein
LFISPSGIVPTRWFWCWDAWECWQASSACYCVQLCVSVSMIHHYANCLYCPAWALILVRHYCENYIIVFKAYIKSYSSPS